MDDKYKLYANKDDSHEITLFSSDRQKLLTKAREYVAKGYFVMITNQSNGKIMEVRV